MIALAAIPSDILACLRRHAAVCYPDECVGVILRQHDRYSFMACQNTDPEPAHGFRVGDDDMNALAEMVRSGARLAVIYHSHVDQPATFSERDRFFARAWPDTLHLVFAVTQSGVIAQHAYDATGVCLDEPVMETA